MMRSIIFAGIVALSLGTAPAFAKDDAGDAAAAAAPTNLTAPKADNAMDSMAVDSTTPVSDPSLAMANASAGSDALANFGPSSGTVVGNRALELRDEILRLRASVNLNSNEFAVLRSSGAAGAVQYHSTVAAITARLQNGTTRCRPLSMPTLRWPLICSIRFRLRSSFRAPLMKIMIS